MIFNLVGKGGGGGADVSGVTASAGDVLTGKDFVNSSGTLVHGSMTNRGNVTATIDGVDVDSYTIPQGYHNGAGTVSLDSTNIENFLYGILGDAFRIPLSGVYNNVNSRTGTVTITYDNGDTATINITIPYSEGDYDREWLDTSVDSNGKFSWWESDGEVYCDYSADDGAIVSNKFYLGEYSILFG